MSEVSRIGNRWRVYIKPFNELGEYSDWIEVTEDIEGNSIGAIQQNLDNAEYDVGVFRNSNLQLKLRNEHGRYSDVDVEQSIFRFKRSDSLVRVTWELMENGPFCGLAEVDDAILSEEIDVFVGLLEDRSAAMDADSHMVQFGVLGRESILDRELVPFSSISNGDLLSEVLETCLNQAKITALLEIGEITCGTDVTIDDKSSLENKTVREAVNAILVLANSVMRIDGDAIRVTPRTAGADVKFTFYGQGSSNGPENITAIKGIKNGLSRTFNYWTWKDTTLFSRNVDSIEKYGVFKKEISHEIITNDIKRQLILDNLRDEFSLPKQEFELHAKFDYGSAEIDLLDRTSIDYPIVYVPSGDTIPICGIAICGEALLPKGLWSFQVASTDHYKVLGKTITAADSKLKLLLREI